ncbi:cysteine proteinase [Metschnikowia bicuspidata]|uniref:ubiquitinyl hydrolase 1 n=1 Tax=Metschnikowia bicuspidata TaxID=27322 RepID=A0A4P9ZJS4_9ASCO|nr:cysteine proteinase [Metschnikowia bicuspidata]
MQNNVSSYELSPESPILAIEHGNGRKSTDSASGADTDTRLPVSGTLPFPTPTDADFCSRILKPVPDYPVIEETHYVWEISDWNAIKRTPKLQSPSFQCGGHTWRITLFPRSNSEALSIYLEPQHPKNETGSDVSDQSPEKRSKTTPTSWYVCTLFALDVWNPANAHAHVPNTASHRFSAREQDWGFSSFILPRELLARGILENNRLNISACVRVIDDSSTGMLWHDFVGYDSKQKTGYVGLANQGATCYLNSLLQLYYVTGAFRALVYDIPTEKMDNAPNTNTNTRPVDNKRARSVALAMQRVFAHMQSATAPVLTLKLTKSFGWDSSDAFTQHDVQELNRILMDTLELATRGSAVENKLNSLFVGAMKSYVKCVDVEYESSRVEPFWDIQLNVRGFQNLHESFQYYVEPELLTGENKYDAGGKFGYQDAKKGVFFQWFPPVLHLQLKRFEYDFMADDLVKIDDMYEYPDLIDLSAYLGDVRESVRRQNWNYKLHGVLVHQGSVSNGHYYAMLKPYQKADPRNTGWYRFDDDKVWKVTPSQVFYKNFGARGLSAQAFRALSGADQNEYILRRATSAYMLVYYREESLPTILPLLEITVPKHVQRQIEDERKEVTLRTQQRLESLHFLTVHVVLLRNFQQYTGFDTFPDFGYHRSLGRRDFDLGSYPEQVKVRKDTSMQELVQVVVKSLGHEPSLQLSFSFYTVKPRANRTARPESLITTDMMEETVLQFYVRHFKRRGEEMVLFAYEPEKSLIRAAPTTPDDVMLLVKHYDVSRNEVCGLGYAAVPRKEPLLRLLEPLSALLKNSAAFELLEEVSSVRIEPVDAEASVERNELITGDILIVTTPGEADLARAYYKFLHSRVHVRIHRSKDTAENEFVVRDAESGGAHSVQMWISTAWLYAEFAAAVARKIGAKVNPERLRYYVDEHECERDPESDDSLEQDAAQGLKRYPVPSTVKLSQMFPSSPATPTLVLEYEVLSIPLAEYESMRLITVHWLKTILHPVLCRIFISRGSSAADLILKVVEKLTVPESLWGGILAWTSVDFKYGDLVKCDQALSEIPSDAEVCCGYFPVEVGILVDRDMYERYGKYDPEQADHAGVAALLLQVMEYETAKAAGFPKSLTFIPVFHFHKMANDTHSLPFLFAIFHEEKWPETEWRLTAKLGIDKNAAFDKFRVALVDDNDKGRYLDLRADLVVFDEIGRQDSTYSMALDHRDRNPRRALMLEKGISIG